MAGGIFGGGTGAVATPLLIEDAHDLNAVRTRSSSGFYFKLANDINLNVPPFNENSGWAPIPYFYGHLDGDGYKIAGLRFYSTGDPVGLFLQMDYRSTVTNAHFDDFYLEMTTESAGTPTFTLLGFYAATNGHYYPVKGCSFVGKLNLNAPNANLKAGNEGLIARLWRGQSSSLYIYMDDVYVDIENIGVTTASIYGTGEYGNQVPYMLPRRNIIKCRGKITSHWHLSSNVLFYGNNQRAFLISDLGYNYDEFVSTSSGNNNFIPRQESSGFGILDFQDYVNSAYNGRTVWYFPPNSHPRMMDKGDERFLIEADGEIYTYNEGELLTKIGVAPVSLGMFDAYGIQYIESVPVTAWGQIRDSLNVEIHCQVKKQPKKTASRNTEVLRYSEAIGEKIVLRCPIVFENHNNDILGIVIPKEV